MYAERNAAFPLLAGRFSCRRKRVSNHRAELAQEPDVNDVIRLCDMHNIPMATNLATAEIIILALDRGDLDWREMYK